MKSEASIRAQNKYNSNPLNREKHRQSNLRSRIKNWNRTLWSAARNRSVKYGHEFTLEVVDIKIPILCPILKIELKHNTGRKGGRDNSASVDRIDPTKGYIKGNIQVISNKANMMKSSATPEELKLFANWIRETYGN